MRNSENTKEAEEFLIESQKSLRRQGKMQTELDSCLDLPKGAYSNWKAATQLENGKVHYGPCRFSS